MSKRVEPNYRIMTEWLIENYDYASMSLENLKNDPTLEIVASACSVNLEDVIDYVLQLISHKQA